MFKFNVVLTCFLVSVFVGLKVNATDPPAPTQDTPQTIAIQNYKISGIWNINPYELFYLYFLRLGSQYYLAFVFFKERQPS